MKLAVVGSRSINDRQLIFEILETICAQEGITEIVSGGARGVDTFAEDFAREKSLKMTIKVAQWDLHGKKAGFIRNVDIWKYADWGIAFWDGKSKGTEHSFKLAKQYNKNLMVVDTDTGEIYLEYEKE